MLSTGIQRGLFLCPGLKLLLGDGLLSGHIGQNERHHHLAVTALVAVKIDDGEIAHLINDQTGAPEPRA